MALESVMDQQLPAEPALAAFAIWDDTVYISWAKAVVDLLAAADVDQTAKATPSDAAHLIYTLMDAAEEYRKRDNDGKRKLAQETREAAGAPA
ncbi:MAG: hypothetical protein ABI870_09190 [Rhodanobacter sp.]